MHRAYQQIIGMGEAALPFIFRELKKGKGDWMWALESITQEDPAPERSTFKQTAKAWIQWGIDHGYTEEVAKMQSLRPRGIRSRW